MSGTPLVTVITVTYKSAPFVADAIKSVLSQSYANLEYIIGDDCSPDDTWDIIKSFGDPRIKAYRNPANLGEYANRNKAISMATGEFVLFIDGDDIALPHAVAFFVSQLSAFPEAAFALQKNYQANILFPALLEPQEAIANAIFGNGLLTASFASTFFRTSVLKKEGGLSERYKGGDHEVRLRLASKYAILLVAGWVTWPRETPGSATTRLTPRIRNQEFLDYFEPIVMSENPAFDDERFRHQILARLQLQKIALFRVLLRTGQWREALACMKRYRIGWLDIARRPKPVRGIDMLERYSPTDPFRRGFLERGV